MESRTARPGRRHADGNPLQGGGTARFRRQTTLSWTDRERPSRDLIQPVIFRSERPIAVLGASRLLPEIVAIQADVRPSKRCDMGQEMIRRARPGRAEMLNRSLQIDRVPIDDCSDHEIEPGRAEVLVLEGSAGDASLAMDIDGLGQEVAGGALILGRPGA